MKKETFEEFARRAHCGQWDFDSLLLWYYEALQEKERLVALISDARERGFIRHNSDCPMDAFYGKEVCNCSLDAFVLSLEEFVPEIKKERLERENWIRLMNEKHG
jgi:hypothetical protein